MNWIPKEAIAPIFTGLFLLLTSLVAYITSRRNAKLGARESRAPDVQELWAQQESDRRLRHLIEDMYWRLRAAFMSYYRRVQAGGSTELNTREQAAVDAKLPED